MQKAHAKRYRQQQQKTHLNHGQHHKIIRIKIAAGERKKNEKTTLQKYHYLKTQSLTVLRV